MLAASLVLLFVSAAVGQVCTCFCCINGAVANSTGLCTPVAVGTVQITNCVQQCNTAACGLTYPICQAVLTNQARGQVVTDCPGPTNPCFHADSLITYKGQTLSLAELKAHPECSVPHVVSTFGSIVTAKCGEETKTLRLTAGHLVYTQRGLQPAGDLTTEDVVFADLAEQQRCSVVSVAKEQSEQKYFGLNCYESQVLASGLKASTFEKIHSVPSFWMAVVGRILGIKQASAIGDHIAEVVNQLNLI